VVLVFGCQGAVVINQITGITQNNLMYTGTIDVGKEKLFFIYYGVDGQTNPDNLNNFPFFVAVGAPGRSAQYSNLAGVGPKLLNKSLGLIDNPNRVTQFTNIMFLDLLGSGYSFASSAEALPKLSK
jgi:carboxypeptidase C (cathepsin A)